MKKTFFHMKHLIKKHHRKIIYTAPVLFFVFLTYAALLNPEKKPLASLELVASSTEGYIGDAFTVDVYGDTDTPINAIEASLSFPPDILEAAEITHESSIVDLWVKEPAFLNDIGVVTMSGGMLKTGGFVKRGKIFTLVFHAKKEGTADISPKTAVFALADGKGTLIMPTAKGLSYTVREKPENTPDLNGNGKVDLSDLGIWITDLFKPYKVKDDINGDKKINLKDLYFFF